MTELTFEQLPKAVGEIRTKLDTIEQLLRQILGKDSDSPISLSEYVNISEAAQILSISKQTIYGYNHQRKIPFYKRGKRVYFKRKELNDWIGSIRVKSFEEIQKEADNYMASRKRKY
jgi:excisionase family DNA binding protein